MCLGQDSGSRSADGTPSLRIEREAERQRQQRELGSRQAKFASQAAVSNRRGCQ